MELEWGFANGSVVGHNEFARTFRLKPHPAQQWLLSVHPRYGVAQRAKLFLGTPEEGSIYRGRENFASY
jgi:hypothetical protein